MKICSASQINEDWEETPRHYLRLDIRTLLQDIAITEVAYQCVYFREVFSTNNSVGQYFVDECNSSRL